MLKYLYCKEVFSEVPEEITLALSISNCQIHCDECNQKELWADIGKPLHSNSLKHLINIHRGISCVCFMGSGNKEYAELNTLAKVVKEKELKVALYLGESVIPTELDMSLYNYIKIGSYQSNRGGLNSPNTNQRMYLIHHDNSKKGTYWCTDITYKFLKDNESKS